jgi:hypothetical protein
MSNIGTAMLTGGIALLAINEAVDNNASNGARQTCEGAAGRHSRSARPESDACSQAAHRQGLPAERNEIAGGRAP